MSIVHSPLSIPHSPSCQGCGDGLCDGVGVGVEQLSCSVVGDGRDDRGDAFAEQLTQALAIGAVDVSDETEVDAFGRDGSAMGADEVEVGTTEAKRIDAACLQLRDDVLVDEAGVDHRDDA